MCLNELVDFTEQQIYTNDEGMAIREMENTCKEEYSMCSEKFKELNETLTPEQREILLELEDACMSRQIAMCRQFIEYAYVLEI